MTELAEHTHTHTRHPSKMAPVAEHQLCLAHLHPRETWLLLFLSVTYHTSPEMLHKVLTRKTRWLSICSADSWQSQITLRSGSSKREHKS